MKSTNIRLAILSIACLFLSCDQWWSGPDDKPVTDDKNIGILDMAFVCRVSGIPTSRVKKVQLSLAYTADYLYEGNFFIQANVSDAVTHYRFDLPPGDYFYYARVVCIAGGDSCQYLGFSKDDGTMAAGGKVSVEKGKVNSFTTNFH